MTDVVRRLAPFRAHEPLSSFGLAAGLRDPRPSRVRVTTVGPRGRSMCAVVRSPQGHWLAYPVLVHPSDAPELARAIDRSAAVEVQGMAENLRPLVPHLTRAGEMSILESRIMPFQDLDGFGEPDDTTRMATAFDLPALHDLFRGYELDLSRSMTGLRRVLSDAVERSWVVVSLDDDEIVGAMVMAGVTPRYGVWDHLSVAPHARQQGRSWSMAIRAWALHRAFGLGVIGVLADTNPMKTPPVMPEEFSTDDHMTVLMSLPNRVPGERRVRRGVWRVRRKVQRSRPSRAGTFSRTKAGLRGDQKL